MNIFDYTDYRKYLRDYYREQKARDHNFTVRYIAEKVGFRSASFFCQLVNGRSNISQELIQKFCRFLDFNKRESGYFECLVGYNQAKDHVHKKRLFEKVISFRQSKLRTIDAKLYEFYDKWYYNAIRELLYFFPFRGDSHELAKALNPAISPTEAKRAVALLESWGLIKRDASGRYVRSDNQSITTGLEAQSFYINNYQHAVLDLAKESLDRFPREEMSLSTLTMSLSSEAYRKIEEEVHLFRRHLLSIAEEDKNEERIYQMNIQLFPMTNVLKRKGIIL
jgi:uncharacterized protein (TIGR02147 family)